MTDVLLIPKTRAPLPDYWWRASSITGVDDGAAITGNWTSVGREQAVIAASDSPVFRAASSAMNSLPAIELDGTAHFVKASGTFTGVAGAVIVVGKLTATGGVGLCLSQGLTTAGTKYVLLGTTNVSTVSRWSYSQRWADTADNILGTTTALTTAKTCLVWHSSGTAISGWVNGVSQTMDEQSVGANKGDWWGDTGADTPNKTVIGGGVIGAGVEYRWAGLISEVAVYDREISTANVLKLSASLMTKYGIT
jgi:hypothetical protein